MMYDIIRPMKRTTIFLPEPLERRLHSYARRAEKPIAEVVREALTKHLDSERREPIRMPPTFDSGRTDISSRLDEFVFQGLQIHGDDPPPGRARRKK